MRVSTTAQARERLQRFGANQIAQERRTGIFYEIVNRTRNPLNGLLLTLSVVSYFLGDARAAVIIATMVILSIVTAFIQEHRSNQAAAKLRALVKTTASVKRRGGAPHASKVEGFVEIPMEEIVPGDLVALSAGDMIPADLRLLSAKDLFINQSTLTGEAMPIEKFASAATRSADDAFDLAQHLLHGQQRGQRLRNGRHRPAPAAESYFGQLADTIAGQRVQTSFEKGIDRFTWLMIRFILVLVPSVFLINGLTKGDWLEALLFALAVAVGLTPEMLPMIVTANLAKGAIAMSRKRVIVKRLHAIQNFGAMDVLCTDKTGTLTQDRIILKRHLDIRGEDCERVLEYAYLNSHYQSGLKNLLDIAVLQHVELGKELHEEHQYRKLDEIPFDFVRRRLSVVLGREDGKHILICKGAIEEVFAVCTPLRDSATRSAPSMRAISRPHSSESAALNADGFRVIAVAYKEMRCRQGGLYGRRRERPDAARLYRVSRSAQGKRRARHSGARPRRGTGEDHHRRQRRRSPARFAARWASRSIASFSAPRSRARARRRSAGWWTPIRCSRKSRRRRRRGSSRPASETATWSASSATASTTAPH